jgi:3-oxoacyl-[acyl-carrier protein] reductase
MGTIDTAFDLRGRVAVVTGAGGGLGKGGATLLAEAGAHVVVVDWRGDLAEQTVAEIEAAGNSAEAAELDVSDRASLDALIDRIVADRGRIDVMVNNAGIITDSTPLTVTEDELDRVMAVNFKGVVFGSQAAARHMIGAGRGSIINVTSGAVDNAFAFVAAYAAAKAAAHQFTRSLAVEVGPKGVRVNAIAPGWVDTPMNERHVRNDDGSIDAARKDAYVKGRQSMSPLGITGEPIDQAFAMLYLASDAARFMTGNVIRPNGGATMPW